MITIKSKAYTKDDAIFVADVINRGICGFCEKYSSYYDPQDIACESCTHKTACADLQSAYHYMLAKALRLFADENTGKVDPLEMELLDS